jgi:hypothetical protein
MAKGCPEEIFSRKTDKSIHINKEIFTKAAALAERHRTVPPCDMLQSVLEIRPTISTYRTWAPIKEVSGE